MNDDHFNWSLREAPHEDAADLMHWRDLYKRFSRCKASDDGSPCAEDLEMEAAWPLIGRLAQNRLGEEGVDDLFRQAGWRLDERRGKELARQLDPLHRLGIHDSNPYDEEIWNLLSPKLRAEYWQFLVRGRLLYCLEDSGHIDTDDVGDEGEIPPRISALVCDELLWIEFQTLKNPDMRYLCEPMEWSEERFNLSLVPEADTTSDEIDSPAKAEDDSSSKMNASSLPGTETNTGKSDQKSKRVRLEDVTPEIREYLLNHQMATAKEIAKAVGCSRGTVVNSLPWKAVSARRKEERGKSARRDRTNIDMVTDQKALDDYNQAKKLEELEELEDLEDLEDLIDEQKRDERSDQIY